MTVVNPSAQSILVHKRPTQSFTVLCKYSQQTINLCLVPIWISNSSIHYKSKLHIKSLNRLNHNLNILSWHFSDSKMGACGHLVDYLDEDLRTSAAVKKKLVRCELRISKQWVIHQYSWCLNSITYSSQFLIHAKSEFLINHVIIWRTVVYCFVSLTIGREMVYKDMHLKI